MFAVSTRRVAEHTAAHVNEQIEQETQARLGYYRQRPEEVPQRLAELDREWDVERALATGSSTLSLLGLALSKAVDRRWLGLTLGVQAFYLQHALQGWCPPLPVFRRLGFRTPREIEDERHALLAMLGQSVNLESGRGWAHASAAIRPGME